MALLFSTLGILWGVVCVARHVVGESTDHATVMVLLSFIIAKQHERRTG
jgi:hypothetical protein